MRGVSCCCTSPGVSAYARTLTAGFPVTPGSCGARISEAARAAKVFRISCSNLQSQVMNGFRVPMQYACLCEWLRLLLASDGSSVLEISSKLAIA
jgi:hypothetical protein